SNDFGYKVKSDIADFYAGKFLTKNLFTDVYADFIRTKTERGGPSVSFATVPVGPPGTSQSVLRSSDREDKELRAGFGLHYQADRFEGDGEYEIRRFDEEFFSRTEQVATVSLAYLPSAETTVATDYSLLLSNGDLADTFDQRIVARVSHRARPNLVFFVEGDNEINRENSGGLASSASRDFNVSDLTAGVDYNRPIGDWLAVTSLALGAGYASVSPGDSGARSDIDASAGLGGTVFRRINLDFNAAYEDHNDNSTFSLDEQVIRGQVVATSNLGNRLQLRGFALAMDFKENGNRFISGPASTRRRLDLEIRQYAAEIGFSYLMARNVYGSLAVGRTSHTSRTLETSGNRNKLESDNNYLAASLNVQPIRNLRLVAIGRFQRGTQPRDLEETQDYLDLQAIYRLRSWEVLLGYTRNKIDIGFTDLEQNRTFLTVRRNFEWRIR
ncbi:MAG: hypothetical protein Q8R92_12975, partial [Deltaproteobacteria bacterium]|nr:hypothetical protein [Deltaproteobacteria bacterium]